MSENSYPIDGHDEGRILGVDVGNWVGLPVGVLVGAVDGLEWFHVLLRCERVKNENMMTWTNYTKPTSDRRQHARRILTSM